MSFSIQLTLYPTRTHIFQKRSSNRNKSSNYHSIFSAQLEDMEIRSPSTLSPDTLPTSPESTESIQTYDLNNVCSLIDLFFAYHEYSVLFSTIYTLLYCKHGTIHQVLEAAGFGRYHIFFMIVLGMMSFADAAEIFMGWYLFSSFSLTLNNETSL